MIRRFFPCGKVLSAPLSRAFDRGTAALTSLPMDGGTSLVIVLGFGALPTAHGSEQQPVRVACALFSVGCVPTCAPRNDSTAVPGRLVIIVLVDLLPGTRVLDLKHRVPRSTFSALTLRGVHIYEVLVFTLLIERPVWRRFWRHLPSFRHFS